ncbi:MAG TPA: hypothetical protein VHR66_00830 [Gemmataceae bacterium]|jgi:hypothetical protein|nr:hypothetical protein [Gemmataceae bacterium]
MCCIIEIASVVFGIIIMIYGRFSLSQGKEVRGPAAYAVALILLSMIPVAVALALLMNWDDMQNGNVQPFKVDAKTILPDAIAVLGCSGLALIVSLASAKPKLQRRRRPRHHDYDDYEDDYDDRPRPRRRRRDEIEDEEDERPRGRRRDERDDDDDDRPRRKFDDLDDRAR